MAHPIHNSYLSLSLVHSSILYITGEVNGMCVAVQGDIHHVINPDPYRGVFGSDAKAYAGDVQDFIDYGTSGKITGFIAETI